MLYGERKWSVMMSLCNWHIPERTLVKVSCCWFMPTWISILESNNNCFTFPCLLFFFFSWVSSSDHNSLNRSWGITSWGILQQNQSFSFISFVTYDWCEDVFVVTTPLRGRRGGLMVCALIPRASSPVSSPGWGPCVVFVGKTLNSHSASLHPGV